MKSYCINLILIVNILFVTLQDCAAAVLVKSDTIGTFQQDSVDRKARAYPNVDALVLNENASYANSQNHAKSAETIKRVPVLNKTLNNSGKRNVAGVTSVEDLKEKAIISADTLHAFNNIVLSLDSIKCIIESIIHCNDSIRTELTYTTTSIKNKILICTCILFFFILLIICFIAISIKILIKEQASRFNNCQSFLQNELTLLKENHSIFQDDMQRCYEQSSELLIKINNSESLAKANNERIIALVMEFMDRLNKITAFQASTDDVSVQIVNTPTDDTKKCSLVSEVQYNDAISEFERINNRLFKLKRYKHYSQELLKFLSTGIINKENYSSQLCKADIADDVKEHLNTILYDIDRFNSQRRKLIHDYVLQHSLDNFDVRFPLFEIFDENLDHQFKGDDVSDGEKISRVCKLGYYFPNSRVAPYRVKSEVDTESNDVIMLS